MTGSGNLASETGRPARISRSVHVMNPRANSRYTVSPMPALSRLPPTPYPYAQKYLFTDGHVATASGFVIVLWLHLIESARLSRKIPYGLQI